MPSLQVYGARCEDRRCASPPSPSPTAPFCPLTRPVTWSSREDLTSCGFVAQVLPVAADRGVGAEIEGQTKNQCGAVSTLGADLSRWDI